MSTKYKKRLGNGQRMRKLFFMFIAPLLTAVVTVAGYKSTEKREKKKNIFFCLQFPNGQRVYVGI